MLLRRDKDNRFRGFTYAGSVIVALVTYGGIILVVALAGGDAGHPRWLLTAGLLVGVCSLVIEVVSTRGGRE